MSRRCVSMIDAYSKKFTLTCCCCQSVNAVHVKYCAPILSIGCWRWRWCLAGTCVRVSDLSLCCRESSSSWQRAPADRNQSFEIWHCDLVVFINRQNSNLTLSPLNPCCCDSWPNDLTMMRHNHRCFRQRNHNLYMCCLHPGPMGSVVTAKEVGAYGT